MSRRGDRKGQCHEVQEAAFVGRDDPGAPLAAISPEVAEKRFTLLPGRRGRRPLHWLNFMTLPLQGAPRSGGVVDGMNDE